MCIMWSRMSPALTTVISLQCQSLDITAADMYKEEQRTVKLEQEMSVMFSSYKC